MDDVYYVAMESLEVVHEIGELDKVENNNFEEDIGQFRNIETEREDLNPSPITKRKNIYTKTEKNINLILTW